MGTISLGILDEEIEAEMKRAAKLAGRASGNFEDQLRAASELLRGLEIIARAKAEGAPEHQQVTTLRDGLAKALASFASSVLEGEFHLMSAPDEKREEAFNYLVSFLMSFASRAGTRERLHLFTTNYDRYWEAGADVAGLRLIDRFVGTLAPVFRASRLDVDLHYNPPGIRGEPRYLEGVARFTKLHGSVDWVDCDRTIRRIGLPFGAQDSTPYLAAPGLEGAGAMRLMIYPNAAKDRETAAYPYVELFRDFASAICRPNSTLVCYGYGFGDEHINRVLADMLTIPSAHLVIISHGDPLGRMMGMYERLGRPAQITLLLGNTGSGKSCSVAGLVRWSLEQAQAVRSSRPNARFIILDPNGEYSRAFPKDDPVVQARIIKVNPAEGETALKVPLWFWNSAEWCSFTQASAKTQRPLLRRALREVKAGRTVSAAPTEGERALALRRYLSSRLISVQRDLRSGAIQTDENKFGFRMRVMVDDLQVKITEYPDNKLPAVRDAIVGALKATCNSFVKDGKRVKYYRAFSEVQVNAIADALRSAVETVGGIVFQEGPDEDVPLPFNGTDLADHLEILAEQENASQYLDFLVARIRTFLSDPRMKAVIGDSMGTTSTNG